MGVYASAGSANEPRDKAGISALASRTASRGTTSRTSLQIAEESELLGGSIGAAVSSESFGWSFSVPAENIRAALALFSDVIQHATLPAEALETERTVMIADAASLRDDMYRYPLRLLTEAAYGSHPYSIPAGGTEESLRGLGDDEVRAWYRDALLRAPFVIALAGNFDADEIANLVATQFGELTTTKRETLAAPTWPATSDQRCVVRDKNQSALVLGFPAPGRNDDRRFAAHVLASIASGLGGRFFEELRDRRSLAYTVHAFGSEHRMAGAFLAYIATAPEREEEARSALLEQFASLRDAPVTDEELSRAKKYMLGMHDIRQERGAAILGDMIDAWLFGGSLAELDEYAARIEAVSAADIQNLARDYFDQNRTVEGLVRGESSSVSSLRGG
jgi:zinc protease